MISHSIQIFLCTISCNFWHPLQLPADSTKHLFFLRFCFKQKSGNIPTIPTPEIQNFFFFFYLEKFGEYQTTKANIFKPKVRKHPTIPLSDSKIWLDLCNGQNYWKIPNHNRRVGKHPTNLLSANKSRISTIVVIAVFGKLPNHKQEIIGNIRFAATTCTTGSMISLSLLIMIITSAKGAYPVYIDLLHATWQGRTGLMTTVKCCANFSAKFQPGFLRQTLLSRVFKNKTTSFFSKKMGCVPNFCKM